MTLTLESPLKRDMYILQPKVNGFCLNTGHFEALKIGMTHDSDFLFKKELRVKNNDF